MLNRSNLLIMGMDSDNPDDRKSIIATISKKNEEEKDEDPRFIILYIRGLKDKNPNVKIFTMEELPRDTKKFLKLSNF